RDRPRLNGHEPGFHAAPAKLLTAKSETRAAVVSSRHVWAKPRQPKKRCCDSGISERGLDSRSLVVLLFCHSLPAKEIFHERNNHAQSGQSRGGYSNALKQLIARGRASLLK